MKKLVALILGCGLIFGGIPLNAYGASHAYSAEKIAGLNAKYVTINMNDKNIKPVALLPNGNISSTASVANLAAGAGAFAAINGTYFDAYGNNKIPIAYNTVIKDGRLIHMSDGHPVFGIKKDGKLIMDRLKFSLFGYINGEHRSIPWRVNHPSVEKDAITLYTTDYGVNVDVMPGAKAAVVSDLKVVNIATSNFAVPQGGFAIVYNPEVAHLVDERFKIGDEVTWDFQCETGGYTTPEDWKDVEVAFGAGPSLVLNGAVTANPAAEGFTEAKITRYATARSFIGFTSDGKIKMGNFAKATVAQAAEACKQMGLVNAMCLDGGGSVGLYYNGKAYSTGRNVNNALGFVMSKGDAHILPIDTSKITVAKSNSQIYVDGKEIKMDAYNINGNNYFKLRDIAFAVNEGNKPFNVDYDNSSKKIQLLIGKKYEAVGGELVITAEMQKQAEKSKSLLLIDDKALDLEAYNIEGNNYFKLRDILKAIDVEVVYDKDTKALHINTANSYKD